MSSVAMMRGRIGLSDSPLEIEQGDRLDSRRWESVDGGVAEGRISRP